MKKIALVFALIFVILYSVRGDFYVHDGDSIQNAINAASNGDIIFIEGFHNESIFINKSIKIEGINHPFVSSIEINCSNVTIDNITANRIIIDANNVTISNNFIYGGIYLNSSNSKVYHNFMINCSVGLIINGSNNKIYQNGFFNNSYGIICNSNGNLIYHNDFIDNGINAIDNGINKWNLSTPQEGNYWSNYNGTDSNHDGIGDTPYKINGSFDFYPLMEEYDIFPPVTNYTIILLNGSMNNGWYIGNVSITLTASDESGINHTYYRINDGEWNEYENAINLTQDGIYDIEFHSVDNLGIWEDIKNVTVKIDKTKPILNYSIYPPYPNGKNGWYNGSVEISFNAIDDNLKALYYMIDNGTWYPYEGYPFIPDGIHVIYLKAVDEAGNFNITNFTLKLDTKPPSIEIEEINESYVKGLYAIHYSVDDEVDKNLSNATLYYSYDNGSHWEFVTNLNGSGEYYWNTNSFNDSAEALLKIVAVDDAGNVGVALSNEFRLDNKPPYVNVITPKEGETFGANETIEITWEAYDTVDKNLDGSISISYFYDGSWHTIINGTSNNGEYAFGTSGLKDGEYKIMVVAVDDAGNVGRAITGNFTIDTTPPSIYISRPLKGYLYVNILGREMLPPIPLPSLVYNAIIVGKISVDVEASDKYSGISRVSVITDEMEHDVTLDKPYQWIWNPSFGNHWLKATAWDNAGNVKSYELDNILCINI